MEANITELEKRLWDAADQLRANSDLKSHEYPVPVLAPLGKADHQAQGVLYLPENARFSKLLDLPEGADIAKAINDAMR